MKRENEILENFKNLSEHKKRLIIKEAEERLAKLEAVKKFRDDYNINMAMRNRISNERTNLMEGARNDALATVVKAIYIGALEANSLTDEGLILAESMVDKWINESGGAKAILSKVCNESYLLARISQIVEEAAEEEVKEIEKVGKEDDTEDTADDAADNTPAEDGVEDQDDATVSAKNFINNADSAALQKFMADLKAAAEERKNIISKEKEADKANNDANKAQEKADKANEDVEKAKEKAGVATDDEASGEGEPDDTSEDNDGDDVPDNDEDQNGKDDTEELKEDPLGDDFDDSDDDEDDDKDPDIDYSVEDDVDEGDDDDEDITIDGDEESDDVKDDSSKGKIFDELEKEDDVKKAVDLIRNRIADAEEKFIKNNAEDKKKVDDLLTKIADNVKTMEDMSDKGEDSKAEVAKESARINKRRINEIRDKRPLTVFESFTRRLSANIIRDESAREVYVNESGSVDTELIVESARVMYGFLETLNTLQLENVNAAYIAKVLNEM